MTRYSNEQKGSTAGNAVTSAAAVSGLNGDTKYDAVIITGGALTYDSGRVLHGNNMIKFISNGASGAAYVQWTSLSGTSWANEGYVYLTSYPPIEMTFLYATDGTTSKTATIRTDGKVVHRIGGTTIGTTTAVIPLNTLIRIENSGTLSSTAGTMKTAFYTLDSTTPIEELVMTPGNTGAGTAMASMRIGDASTTTITSGWTFWFGSTKYDDSLNGGYIGPPGDFTLPAQSGTLRLNDAFTGTDGAAPDSTKWTPVLTTGATVALSGNKVLLTPGTGSYATFPAALNGNGAPAIPNTDWDYMVLVYPANPIAPQYIAIIMSTTGTLRSGDVGTGNGYNIGLVPNGNTFSVGRTTSGSVAALSGDLPYTYTAGVPVNVRVQHTAANVINVWIWNYGTTPPSTPSWTGTDAAPISGTLRPMLAVSNASSSTPTPASFDNVSLYSASTTRTQGWFINIGGTWFPYTAYVKLSSGWVAAPAFETA
jgi:hypothetical protein